jgi:hypothetical protein
MLHFGREHPVATVVLGAALLWLAVSAAVLALVFRRSLATAWREPVLRAPVLILESDDWGYGPLAQQAWLDRIADVLGGFRDRRGCHPVMTLGVVLAGPDTDRIRSEQCRRYHRLAIADSRFAPIREAMIRGASRGVFALQLHGLEHYWPESLMNSARVDERVRRWLIESGLPRTESLPPGLQSRWIDAASLPSRPLPPAHAMAAAAEEVAIFASVFGIRPDVAVPSTFVWTRDLESAWARAGIRVLVTPGHRCDSRGADAKPIPTPDEYYNGQTGPDGMSYVVRDIYFEPSLGHTHARALEALRAKTRLGRPALLEIHRMNFIGEESTALGACEELASLLASACEQFPNIRFMSTSELARQYRERSDLAAAGVRVRIHFLLRRLATFPRLRKLAWASGVAIPAWIAYRLTWPRELRSLS